MPFFLLYLFAFCSCVALASPSFWYIPTISYWIWALKCSMDAVQHKYMYLTCIAFSIAFGFRAVYHHDDPNFKAFVIYAIVYAILYYVSFKHVRAVVTYKAPDEEEDDSDAES